MNKTFDNCTLLDTKTWFEKAVPTPEVKNFTTQLGVMLEEVSEALSALSAADVQASIPLQNCIEFLNRFGDHLKSHPGCVTVTDPLEFLDGLCDVIVTATGTAHMQGYDVVGAMTEVNRSNFSKFDADGKPIFHPETRKIMKGPAFSKPVLGPYLPQ